MDAFQHVINKIDEFRKTDKVLDRYYSFEPWDVEKRPAWLLDQARRDGIDLYSEEMIRCIGADPHPFQTGIMLSTSFCTSVHAGTSLGKSYPILMKIVAMLTGVIPISLKFDRGADTGVKRTINAENIERFGRFDTTTGTFIDNDTTVPLPTGWKEWDCGNIKGVGKFPEQLILPPGGEIWLLTTQRVLLNFWWPRFQDPMRRIIPEHLIDKTKNGGYKEKDRTVFLQRDSKIGCITYESGFDKAEGQRANVVIFDEEPPQEKMFHAGMQHGDMIMLIETPYRGITWSKDVVFPKTVSSDYSSFHATQYDSPYQGRAKIEARRKTMPKYEIKARIWGIASDIEGKPYYDYDKLSIWVQRYAAPQYTLATFDPQSDFRGIRGLQFDDQTFIPGLLETMIKRGKPSEPDGKATWCMYEDVIEGQAYLLLADPAEGAEDPEEAQDVCASMIMRPPIAEKEEDRPKIVASLRSTLPTIAFARVCSYAARYYNNSMLGAETMRHAVNAAFAAELRDWPYWYHMTVTNDKTKTAKTCVGFDPNSKTRFSIFELIGEWIDSFEACQYPGIPDYPLLVELMECVVGKHGRPDHTRNGTLDSTMCFGTGLHILKFSPEQVRCNGSNKQTLSVEEKRARWYGARHPKRQPDNCGLSMLGYKNGS